MSFSFPTRLSTSSEGLARKDRKCQCPRRLMQALISLTSKVFPKIAPGRHAQSNAVYPPLRLFSKGNRHPLMKWQPVQWDFLVHFTTMGPWRCIQMKVNFYSPSFLLRYHPELNKVAFVKRDYHLIWITNGLWIPVSLPFELDYLLLRT